MALATKPYFNIQQNLNNIAYQKCKLPGAWQAEKSLRADAQRQVQYNALRMLAVALLRLRS